MSTATALGVLLALALGIAAGLAVLVIGELRWEARARLPRCPTCGERHDCHSTHR